MQNYYFYVLYVDGTWNFELVLSQPDYWFKKLVLLLNQMIFLIASFSATTFDSVVDVAVLPVFDLPTK